MPQTILQILLISTELFVLVALCCDCIVSLLNAIHQHPICILGIERGSWCVMSRLLFELIMRAR